jgi:hypothetical protein
MYSHPACQAGWISVATQRLGQRGCAGRACQGRARRGERRTRRRAEALARARNPTGNGTRYAYAETARLPQ